jgi:hypothetical protein
MERATVVARRAGDASQVRARADRTVVKRCRGPPLPFTGRDTRRTLAFPLVA